MRKNNDIFGYIHKRPWLSLIIGGLILVTGLIISDIPKMFVSLGWPTTQGTIVHHTRGGQRFEEYDGDFYTNIEVYIRYEYTVDGLSYSSLTINSIYNPFNTYPTEYADRYPVGKEVIVYYNPKKPAEAVLEPGFVNVLKAFGIYSYVLFVLGIYFIYLGISKSKEIKLRKRLNMQV